MKFETSINRRTSGKHRASARMENFKGKTILDVGCSFGIFEKLIEKKAKKILAIDISGDDLKIAKKEVKTKNIQFQKGGVFDIQKITKEKFDIVTFFDVIEHIPKNSEIKALKIINNSLEKQGILLLTTPKSNFTNFLDPAWYFGHRHYNENEIREFLKKSGFKTKKRYSRGGFFEIFSMFLFYFCKWIFNSEIPYKDWFDKKRNIEYLDREGYVTWFIVAQKQKH